MDEGKRAKRAQWNPLIFVIHRQNAIDASIVGVQLLTTVGGDPNDDGPLRVKVEVPRKAIGPCPTACFPCIETNKIYCIPQNKSQFLLPQTFSPYSNPGTMLKNNFKKR